MKDKKRFVFGGLNLVQGLLVGAIPMIVSSRIDMVNKALAAVAILMIIAAPAIVFGGKWGRRFAAAVCILYWIAGLVGTAAIVGSASYLYGIYGHHGASAGGMAFVLVALVMVGFWLIPAHELNYLRKTGAAK